MEYWLEETTPYVSSEQIAEQHRQVQETWKENLKSELKGTDEFKIPFIDLFLNVYFIFLYRIINSK